jgi:GT2 family glycosyltransferase
MKSNKNIVVTLMYDKWELTKRFIRGLIVEEWGSVDKILIIDNGSTESAEFKLLSFVEQDAFLPGTIEIGFERLDKNIGFTLGANYGLKLAIERGNPDDLIFLISNDVQINGKFIEQAEGFLHGRPCLVGNRHIAFDSGWNTFNGKTFNYLEGYFLAMTSAGWQDVGLFDPNYAPFDYEDIDLSTTAKSKGYRLVSLNNPNIVHQNGGTIGFNPEREAITLRNKEYFRQKWVK